MARFVADHPVPKHLTLPVADELLAWGALRAAQLSEREGEPVGVNPVEIAVRIRQAPRCRAAVVAGGYLGVALTVSRESAYAVVRAVFLHVPYRSDLHPALLVVAGRAGLIVEPRWLSWAIARAPTPPDVAAASLVRAAYRGFGPQVAVELWDAFMAPALEALPAPWLDDGAPALMGSC